MTQTAKKSNARAEGISEDRARLEGLKLAVELRNHSATPDSLLADADVFADYIRRGQKRKKVKVPSAGNPLTFP